jgi:hypothetical protein
MCPPSTFYWHRYGCPVPPPITAPSFQALTLASTPPPLHHVRRSRPSSSSHHWLPCLSQLYILGCISASVMITAHLRRPPLCLITACWPLSMHVLRSAAYCAAVSPDSILAGAPHLPPNAGHALWALHYQCNGVKEHELEGIYVVFVVSAHLIIIHTTRESSHSPRSVPTPSEPNRPNHPWLSPRACAPNSFLQCTGARKKYRKPLAAARIRVICNLEIDSLIKFPYDNIQKKRLGREAGYGGVLACARGSGTGYDNEYLSSGFSPCRRPICKTQ